VRGNQNHARFRESAVQIKFRSVWALAWGRGVVSRDRVARIALFECHRLRLSVRPHSVSVYVEVQLRDAGLTPITDENH
jgi:hypothetical protein